MKYCILSGLISFCTFTYILVEKTVLPLVILGKPTCQEYQESYQCSLLNFGCPSDNICYTEDQYNKMVNVINISSASMIGMIGRWVFLKKKETFSGVIGGFFCCLLMIAIINNKEK